LMRLAFVEGVHVGLDPVSPLAEQRRRAPEKAQDVVVVIAEHGLT